MDPLGQCLFIERLNSESTGEFERACTRSLASAEIRPPVPGYPLLSSNDMARIWIHKNGKTLSNDYHDNIDAKCFYEWLEQSLPFLRENAVIVMDNAAIHNKRPAGTPTSSTCKADMQLWLTENNVDFSPKELRTELWQKIKVQYASHIVCQCQRCIH